MEKNIFAIALFFLFIFVLLYTVHATQASGSLLAYWKLDETTTGSTAVDSSGNGHDGTPNNSPVPSNDVPSTITFSDPKSLFFDGSKSQYISVPNSSAFAMTSATFSVWVKFTDLSQGDMDMIAIRDNSGEVQWQFGYRGDNNQFKVSLANGGNSCCTDFFWSPSPALTTNVWYNVAVAIDGTNNTLTWYQNGVQKSQTSIAGHNLGTEVNDSDLYLGATSSGGSEFLYGYLDDVRIYNTALSGSDIADIASGDSGPGVPTPTPSPSPTPTPTVTPTPTITPTPTVTPLPTSPPGSSSQTSNSSSSSNSTNTSCTDLPPTNAPNLYHIDTTTTTATLYVTPVNNTSLYTISYGPITSADTYAAQFINTNMSGAIKYTIHALSPNTRYYFKTQAANGCTPGPWSSIVSATTSSNAFASFLLPVTNSSQPSSNDLVTSNTIVENTTPTPTVIPNFAVQNTYSLDVRVKNGTQPVIGATITLHSVQQQAITDGQGIAHFDQVEGGNHTILLAYQGYKGQENISVTGNNKDVAINMNVKLNNTGISPFTKVFIGILVAIIIALAGFIFFLIKRRKKQDKAE